MTIVDDVARSISTVWTPATLGIAWIAGTLLGAIFLAYIARRPAYVSDASPAWVAFAVAIASILAGAVFYAGQIIVDPLEDVAARLISRFSVWVLYSIAMAFGTWLGLVLRNRRHRRRIRARAVSELGPVASDQPAE